MEIEVSLKVRSAIKAKLLELGVHVDDELPDYIMVLVANRRSRPQMENDLELFLNENTQKFTTWLFHVLKKLEQVTLTDSLPSVTKDGKESTNKATSKTKSKTSSKEKSKGDTGRKRTTSRSSESTTQSKSTTTQKEPSNLNSSTKAPTKVKSIPKVSVTKETLEKTNEGKVVFKLKSNLSQKTEFDKKQEEAETRKTEKTSSSDPKESGTSVAGDETNNSILPTVIDAIDLEVGQEDILNLASDDEGGDLFEIPNVDIKNQERKSGNEDKGKTRSVELISDSTSSRRKLGTGNVDSLRGLLMSNEKVNTKRKRSEEESESKGHGSSSKHKRSEESPPRKLRSVVATAPTPKSTEYDPSEPNIRKLSSVVCVTSNVRPRRNTSSMNTNLIFKAMKEVEIDNIKRPIPKHEDLPLSSNTHRRRSDHRDYRQERRKRKSRTRSRSREHRRKSDGEHHHSNRKDDRRESNASSRSKRSKHGNSRSRSPPLQLFTRRGRMSVKDRLGERAPGSPKAGGGEEVEEYYLDEDEIRAIEKDLNIVIKVPNIPEPIESEITTVEPDESDFTEKAKEGSDDSGTDEKVESPDKNSYIAPSRISIRVVNSSDEESGKEGSDNEDDSEDELIVTVNEDRDIDDLLPPLPQQPQLEEKEVSPATTTMEDDKTTIEPEPTKKVDRLADLRERLAAITRSNTASYSPLPNIQPAIITKAKSSIPTLYSSPQSKKQGPSTCKFWPTCSFGHNCIYTHPKCKYGDLCTKRPTCAYKHDSSSSPEVTSSPHLPSNPTKPVGIGPGGKKICMYFPKCHTMDCTFFHPKPCRYGVSCKDSFCLRYHPGKPVRHPTLRELKWSKSNPSENNLTAITSKPTIPPI